MFYKFLKKYGIALFSLMIAAVVFLAGVLCGLFICCDNVEQVKTTPPVVEGAKVEEARANEETAAKVEETAAKVEESPVNMGEFTLTAYCPCESCSDEWGNQTSTGATAKEGRTVAVDPKVIPYGSVVIINGVEYVAEDCGAAIKGNKIDIYFESHEEAKQFGVQNADVFLKV